MNKFKYYFILLLAGVSLVSCNKSDDDEVVAVPLRDYQTQYNADNDSIVKYLKTNYMTVINSPGTLQDQDVVIKKIVAGDGNVSIWDQTTYPLQSRPVYSNDVTYKVYFLTLRKGVGSSPMNTDKVVTAYTGSLLDGTVFDTSYGYPIAFNLFPYANELTVIEGWSEIFPQFKTGTSTTAGNGVITYSDFGAGVMFLPSGLGYYSASQTGIPAYTPIVFSFKLFDLQRMDNEFSNTTSGRVFIGDGVPDYLEDLNNDGYLYDYNLNKTKYPNPPADWVKENDTDGDGISDFLDFDDDGDGFTTRFEISKPTGLIGIVNGVNYGTRLFYPWEPTVDNPLTPNVDETEPRGIPRRPTGALGDPSKSESSTNVKAFLPEDYTANPRLRMHLDKTYPIKQN